MKKNRETHEALRTVGTWMDSEILEKWMIPEGFPMDTACGVLAEEVAALLFRNR